MQDETNTPKNSRGQNTTGHPAFRQFNEPEDAESAVLENPSQSSKMVAEILAIQMTADPAYLLGLARKRAVWLVLREKAKQARADKRQYLLPGLGDYPETISRGGNRGECDLLTATARDCERSMNEISQSFGKRKEKSPKYQKAKALYEFMHMASQDRPGLTVGEAFGLVEPRK